MKIKLMTTMMTAALLLGAGTSTAYAVDAPVPTYVDGQPVSLNKNFKLTNPGTTSPAETFAFSIEKISVQNSQYTFTDMPVPTFQTGTVPFTQGQATVDPGTTLSTLINLPTYDHVGVFTYKITETIGDTAGVNYDTKPMYLKVTVIEQNGKVRVAALHYENETGVKTEALKNTFSAGNLEVKKEVTGNLGERDRYFDVTVTFTAPAGKDISTVPVTYTGGQYATTQNVTFVNGVATVDIQVKNGDTVTFDNLPYGVTYTVVEDDYTTGDNSYITQHNFEDSNKTVDTALDKVNITNSREQMIDTGISLDNLPYILLLTAAAGGLVIYVVRKRKMAENQ